MPLTAEVAAQQVQVTKNGSQHTLLQQYAITNPLSLLQERLRSIQGLIHDIDNERRRNEPNLNNLFRTEKQLSVDDKSSGTQQKLKNLYKMSLSDAAQEENLIRQALAKVQEIRTIRNERRIQVGRVFWILYVNLK